MQHYKKYIFTLFVACQVLVSCDKGFDNLNINKVDPTALDPQVVMNNAILLTVYPDNFATLGMLTYNFPIVQQIVTPFGSSLSGGNFNVNNTANTGLVWNNFYRNVLKQNLDVIDKTKDNPARTNLYNQARIIKAHSFMILTDTYGDIPYSEAGQGFISGISYPKYDKQQNIYTDILKELDGATAALDASKATSSNDILYGGDIAKWKKFGYSLLLRAAMRLSKVAPDVAKTYVAKAVAGGLMQANSDNAVVRHTSLYNNWIAVHLAAREKGNFYIAKPFLDFLKTNNDPRLMSIAVAAPGAKAAADQNPPRATTDPSKQKGFPMGYDNVSIASQFAANGVTSLYEFSYVNLNTVLSLTAPEYLVTLSETQLLLAEAVVRTWASGDAAALYKSAIEAHMRQMADYSSAAAISEAAIATYTAANPLVAATALNQINTQYWVSSFMNGSETWANFRRSGFPALAKNPFPSGDVTGNFIRRMPYPDAEGIVNTENVNAAIAAQGPNTLNTPVWWDK